MAARDPARPLGCPGAVLAFQQLVPLRLLGRVGAVHRQHRVVRVDRLPRLGVLGRLDRVADVGDVDAVPPEQLLDPEPPQQLLDPQRAEQHLDPGLSDRLLRARQAEGQDSALTRPQVRLSTASAIRKPPTSVPATAPTAGPAATTRSRRAVSCA